MSNALEISHIGRRLPYGVKFQYRGILNTKEFSEHNKKKPKSPDVFDSFAELEEWNNSRPKEIFGEKISEIKQINLYKKGGSLLKVGMKHGYLKSVFYSDIKPILRPLSDLTKPITHKGETFVPMEKLIDSFSDHHDFLVEIWEENDKYMLGTPSLWAYELVQKLIEWHFHIDEPEGTWIDVNTLDENPYK